MKLILILLFSLYLSDCPVTKKAVIEKGCNMPSDGCIECYLRFTDRTICLLDVNLYHKINIRDSVNVKVCDENQIFISK